MTDYGMDYLKRLYAAVSAFEVAFESWMETQVESDHMQARGLFPTAWAKEDADEGQIRERELQLAEAAGVASRAVTVTGAQIAVQGLGLIDPIANWSMMRNPKALLSPQDIRMTTSAIKGRLQALISDAEAAQDSHVPAFSPAQLHPVIWSAAAAQWTAHHYRIAVREAAEALNLHWKTKLNRLDANDTSFWQQTLSAGDPSPGNPKLAWPGSDEARTTKSIRGGLPPLATSLKDLASGLNLTVRNAVTHSTEELSEQEAMERLAAYSYLARMLDGCEVRRAAENGTS